MEIGNYLADRLADGDMRVIGQILNGSTIGHVTILGMPHITTELRASSRFVFSHMNVPVSEQQIRKLHDRNRLQGYLHHRQRVSTRRTKWT